MAHDGTYHRQFWPITARSVGREPMGKRQFVNKPFATPEYKLGCGVGIDKTYGCYNVMYWIWITYFYAA